MAIKAVTFDFWRTLFRDTRSVDRSDVRVEALIAATGIARDQARAAFKRVLEAYMRVHVYEQRTLRPEDAVPLLEGELGIQFDPGVIGELTETFATAILQAPPDPIDDALEAVKAAAEWTPVGLISDTGISPGASLTALLEREGFRPYFRHLTFSDVVGVSKPQPAMFRDAAAGLDVEPHELLHIGDLEPTDIQGAIALGARASLFAGDNDKYLGRTQAHYTFTTWREFREQLPALLR